MTYGLDATITFGGSPTGVMAPPESMRKSQKKNINNLLLKSSISTLKLTNIRVNNH